MKTTLLTLLALALMITTGCANLSHSQPNTALAVETASSQNIKVLWTDTHQENNKLIVHGAIERDDFGGTPMTAHINVKVLSADGSVLFETCSDEVVVPRHYPGSGMAFKRFQIELDSVPASNATLLVTAHQGDHDA